MGVRPGEGDETLASSSDHVGTGALARPAERSSARQFLEFRQSEVEAASEESVCLRV